MGFIEQIGTAGLIIIAILAILFNAFLIYSRSKRIRQALETAKKEQIALEKAKADLTKNPNQVQEHEQEETL
jgi:Flp pilus assembly protein TadB